MRFLADGTERHGSRDEPTEDILYRLYLLNGYRVAAKTKKVTQEDRYFLSVHQPSELLELCIRPRSGGKLQGSYRLRIPSVLFTVFAVSVDTFVGQE